MAWVMYEGYQSASGAGWLLIGWPFALVAAIAVPITIQRVFPTKARALCSRQHLAEDPLVPTVVTSPVMTDFRC